jgi:hypothetical protein
MTFRTRGFLPHLETAGAFYFVTFRLADSLPNSILEDIQFERSEIEATAKIQNRRMMNYEQQRLQQLQSEKIQAYLDAGRGNCWLGVSEIAKIVVDAIQFFDGVRYKVIAWCVMPNHVHAVLMTFKRKFTKKPPAPTNSSLLEIFYCSRSK